MSLEDLEMGETPSRGNARKLIVPIVILAGAAVGLTAALNLQNEFPSDDIGLPFPGQSSLPYEYLQYHVVLSTISLALILVLIVLYANTYVKTRANFMLGLVVVFFALFLQGILQYPLLHLLMNGVEQGTFFSPVSDLFTIVAYSVFLYLSLE